MSDETLPPKKVASERDLVDVLAYLVTAARTQVDEAAEYAPLRLITAAQRLAESIDADASPPVRAFVEAIRSMPATAVPRSERAEYIARVDAICVAAADCLLAMDPPESA